MKENVLNSYKEIRLYNLKSEESIEEVLEKEREIECGGYLEYDSKTINEEELDYLKINKNFEIKKL